MQLRDLFDEVSRGDSRVIPLELQQLLRRDLDVSSDWRSAEDLLLTAREQLPQQLEVLVALYKLYAYSNRFDDALQVIDETLALASQQAGFAADWRQLDENSAAWNPARGALRTYLYSLKATGFVRLRRGDLNEAWTVLLKLQQLDPMDQVGGSVVRDMAERLLDDD